MLKHLKHSLILASALFVVGCPRPTPPSGACTPYAPNSGPFQNNFGPFTAVPVSPNPPAQSGNFSIVQNQSTIVVMKGNTTTVAQIAVPQGILAFFSFYGANSRFLGLDLHTNTSTPPVSFVVQPVVVDLSAFSTGPLSGNFLPQQQFSYPPAAGLHWFPSAGNALAFLNWYGYNNQVQNVSVFRSDTGAALCQAPAGFTWTSFVNASITGSGSTATVQFLDGSTPVPGGSCPLPTGKLQVAPASQNFGTIAPGATAQQVFTFTNIGGDCLTIQSISSSAHFHPLNFPIGGIPLTASQSAQVTVVFQPNSATGTFNETLTVTSSPVQSVNAVVVSGTSAVGSATLTLNEVLQPDGDPGRFNLQIDGATLAADVPPPSGTTGPQVVAAGTHAVGETAGTGTNLSVYSTTIDCGSGPTNGTPKSIVLAARDNKTCTISNLGPQPQLKVVLKVLPPGDTDAFNIAIDALSFPNQVDGAVVGPVTVSIVTPLSRVDTITIQRSPLNYSVQWSGDCIPDPDGRHSGNRYGPDQTGAIVDSITPGTTGTCVITATKF